MRWKMFILIFFFVTSMVAFFPVSGLAEESSVVSLDITLDERFTGDEVIIHHNSIFMNISSGTALALTATLADGTKMNCTYLADWNTLNPDIAIIGMGGNPPKRKIIPVRDGSTVVTAKYGGLETSIPVIITQFTVKVDGTIQVYEQPPLLLNGSALCPARDILQSLGATISWDGVKQTVTASKGDTEINLTIGSPVADVNGTPVVLEQPPLLINGRTMIPVRRICETFGARIHWNEGTRAVEINIDKQKIVVGSDVSFPPFEYSDLNTWKFIGFDIDLINAIAEEANLEVEIKNLPFNELIPALKNKEIDAIVSAMTITEFRKTVLGFSDSYFESGPVVAVRSDNNSIKGLQDLRGKTIGVIIGSTGHQYANEVPEAEVVASENLYNLIYDLESGKYDAVISDFPNIIHHIKQGSKVKVVGEKFYVENYGIAVARDNTELLQLINNGLRVIKENGEYSRMYKKWFIEVK